MRMDDFSILQRLQNQEAAALEELIHEYESYVTKIVSNILLPHMSLSDVQEVVNDTFYNLWLHGNSIDLEKGTIRAYLTTTARNTAKNKFRECRKEVPLQDYDKIETSDMFDQLAAKEKSELLGSVLLSLPPEEREILIRYYYFYQNTSTISQIMNLRTNTVKSKLWRARKKLKKLLHERGLSI